MAWKLEDWEATIAQIVADLNAAPKRGAKQKILDAWRAKLEQPPTNLQPFQIDLLIREVHRRINTPGP